MKQACVAALTDVITHVVGPKRCSLGQAIKPPATSLPAPCPCVPRRFLLEALQELREQLRSRYGAPLLFCLDAPAGAARAVASAALQAGGHHVDLYHLCEASPDSAEHEACCP